ncbi:MAG: glycosyltransferase family 39 protein [Candidatus Eisenbacteria bacterium]|nr:glycosyltransferase family 39 protein [Candidatus Eisenbacteria bacterium]
MKRLLRNPVFLCLAVTALAAVLRFHDLGWGFPDIYEEGTVVRKAWGFWAWDRDGFDFNPRFFNYPTLYFYVQFGAQAAIRAWGEVTGALPDAEAFRAAYYLHPGLFYGTGRAVTALLGSATVTLLFLIGWRIGGARVAVPAALFLALHALHVHKSRFVEVDVAMTFFVALSSWASLRYLREGRLRDGIVAGAAAGLAAATKYPAAVFLIQPVWAWALRRERGSAAVPVLAVTTAGAAFLLASPYVLLDWPGFLRDFGAERLHMRAGHFGGVAGGFLGAARHFTGGFEPPLALVAAAGAVLAAVRPRGDERLFWPAPFLLFLLLALSRMQAPHYPLPAAPALALLAAVALDRAFSGGKGRRRLLVAATILLLILPARRITAEETARRRGDTRARAREWVERHVPAGALVLMEPYGPQLFTSETRDRYAGDSSFADIRELLLDGTSSRPWYRAVTLPSFSIDVDRSERFYEFTPYQWFEYVVLSADIYERYLGDPERFPAQNRFYRLVKERYDLAARFDPEGGTGPTILVYRPSAPPPSPLEVRLGEGASRDERCLLFLRSVGKLYEERGWADPALRVYEAILRERPDDPEVLFYLGFLLGGSGDPEGGIVYLRRSLDVDPANRQVRMNLGVLLCMAGRLDEGIALFHAMLGEREADPEVHGNLASALLSAGDGAGAERHFRRFLEIAPSHPRAAEIRRFLRERAQGSPR